MCMFQNETELMCTRDQRTSKRMQGRGMSDNRSPDFFTSRALFPDVKVLILGADDLKILHMSDRTNEEWTNS